MALFVSTCKGDVDATGSHARIGVVQVYYRRKAEQAFISRSLIPLLEGPAACAGTCGWHVSHSRASLAIVFLCSVTMLPTLRNQVPPRISHNLIRACSLQMSAEGAAPSASPWSPPARVEDGMFSRIGDAHCHAQLDENAQRLVSDLKVRSHRTAVVEPAAAMLCWRSTSLQCS